MRPTKHRSVVRPTDLCGQCRYSQQIAMRRLDATSILVGILILVAAARGEEGPRHKARAPTGPTKVPRKSAFEFKIGLHTCGWGAKPLPDVR